MTISCSGLSHKEQMIRQMYSQAVNNRKLNCLHWRTAYGISYSCPALKLVSESSSQMWWDVYNMIALASKLHNVWLHHSEIEQSNASRFNMPHFLFSMFIHFFSHWSLCFLFRLIQMHKLPPRTFLFFFCRKPFSSFFLNLPSLIE